MAHVIDKIEKLRKNFEKEDSEQESLDEIKAWEKKAKRALAYRTLGRNEIIREIIKDYEGKISDINNQLQNNESLKDNDRTILFRERSWHQDFINLFTSAEEELESLEKAVDENLGG